MSKQKNRRPWIPDEHGNKIEIPEELYSEIHKMIKNIQSKDLGIQVVQSLQNQRSDKIIYQSTSQKDIDNFFNRYQNNFLSKDKRNT
jgi:hypothetical protein